jgi:hypothetical protein
MENYICINGKKAELTEEQMKALGIELPKKSPFERVEKDKCLYYITNRGVVEYGVEKKDFYCSGLYNAANYCTDKSLMEQRALHETLSRRLWRYSMEHGGDKIHLNHCWGLGYSNRVFEAYELWGHVFGECVFYSKEIANNAIKEIIEPFMKAHPEFKW